MKGHVVGELADRHERKSRGQQDGKVGRARVETRTRQNATGPAETGPKDAVRPIGKTEADGLERQAGRRSTVVRWSRGEGRVRRCETRRRKLRDPVGKKDEQADQRSLARDALTSRRATSHVSPSGFNRSRVSCSRSNPRSDRAHQFLRNAICPTYRR